MKERQSNFELLRIIAMLMVVLVHCNYYSLGAIDQISVINNPSSSFIRIFTEQLTIICVNVFILISGWFGIRPSLKGAVSILFQIIFYGLLLLCIGLMIGIPIPLKPTLKVFFLGVEYWFIPSYMILYVLSPVLNSFFENSPPKTIRIVLICFFFFEFAIGWIKDFGSFNDGYSPISFIGLYLLARYIRRYSIKLISLSAITDFTIYILLSLIPTIIALYGQIYFGHSFGQIKYSSPFVVGASLFFLLMFNKVKFSCRTINQLGVSAFSIYLIHQHPIVIPYFKMTMRFLYDSVHGSASYILIALMLTITLGIGCIIVDQLRIFVWKYLCKFFLDSWISRTESVCEKVLSKGI